MSWLWGASPVDPTAPTFHPVSSRFPPNELAGPLETKDLEWACAGGFVTETQTFYNFLDDGSFLMVQVVHSSIGVWYPTVQLTFKMYNPTTKEKAWRSVNVANFVTPPPGLDKRSCKSDQFTVTYKSKPGSDEPESYTIQANATDDLQISLEVTRSASASGWKVGKGPKGGFSYYGPDTENPEGYVIHRFWPRTMAKGIIVYKGKAITANGPGMHVRAILGMRPNLIASRWNFCDFQSDQHGGVSGIQMELTTYEGYGRRGAGSGGVKVNIGSLVVGGKLACVTAETIWPDEAPAEDGQAMSRASHHDPSLDNDTTYHVPARLDYVWAGPSVVPEAPGRVKAKLSVDVGTPAEPKGLIEKVDVLAEIPTVVKTVVSYVSGTQPYIYQWYNPATLKINAPAGLLPDASGDVSIAGTLYNESTFVS
ncbi:survival factor 1 [Rickenella mellea]|uniref:Survival factor 1 n=1 Tax=Rickenella mellea TaxID=50990 RepID=A0A4Y7PNJ1_9AGAM|nr:survival factor 1 [Rickenella mellea]